MQFFVFILTSNPVNITISIFVDGKEVSALVDILQVRYLHCITTAYRFSTSFISNHFAGKALARGAFSQFPLIPGAGGDGEQEQGTCHGHPLSPLTQAGDTCHQSGPRGWHLGGLWGCFDMLSKASPQHAAGGEADNLSPEGTSRYHQPAWHFRPTPPANIIFPERWYWRQGGKQSHHLLLAKARLLRTILFLKHTEGKQQYTREAGFL